MTTPARSDWTPDPELTQQRPLPTGATTSTWSIWVMALLPLLGIAITIAEDPGAEFQRIITRSVQQLHAAQNGVVTTPTAFDGSTLLSLGSSLVLIAVQVGLAIADERALRRLGVIRPFPWAWVLLNPTYLIGRHVVVRRRVGGSLAPLWTWTVTEAVSLVVITIVFTTAISAALTSVHLP